MFHKSSAEKISQLARRSVLVSTKTPSCQGLHASVTQSATQREHFSRMSVSSPPSLPFSILPLRSRNTATMDDSSENSNDGRETRQKHVARPLRYRTRALWLLGIYILLILIPWVLTCVLAHRPINSNSYMRQQGFLDHDVSNMRKWKIALDVLNSITGLITSKQKKIPSATSSSC
jgi:hypothetical protein